MTTVEILDAIASMSVMEVSELVTAMEEKFGVTAAAPVAVAAGPAVAAEAVEEQTEFDVILKGFADGKKIGVIKEVRSITGLGLKEAKEMVEGADSVVKEAISKEDAAKIKEQLEAAGATIEIK
ncbi:MULTISPECIES: 50S ribosomal protein L7/L12 [unclassified Oceanispirochaeta]|uniref:50S ribosomal protein L7/L12 n=1 Tax=unclassified Oceanispirochaeta TaxID=2635722 RepID=UPI000E094187|nr:MULTISPECIES: 50S ribosomal protein L7/L12 [unclassified Oceanispirochaeta]MBF9017122.1 50S ribosomal protein L7/L12 [Oceanispirochaeta sp. M2]NPD73571.1 50S ribosomal protein L7/L12 [Oceanispirochaeta sp. M1]RDG30675.1 50S ribosomal protein L7/L12 [Oceanispirochaeta sp. M1]